MLRLLIPLLSVAPASALACGAFACNNGQPINQAAERILFVPEGERLHMHVKITYEGPPTGFAWILPVPPGVETGLSSEVLFDALDANHAPRFQMLREDIGACEMNWSDAGAPDAAVAPGVEVLSREAVGPYDRVILQAAGVADLRTWLDENGFAVPNEIDARLAPYIERGAHFVAIRLQAEADSGDIVPLRLTLDTTTPTIPVVPTAIAATQDMGIIVHILGASRAVPTNYRHVVINMAAIDWRTGGGNYADVVSAAIDEAGGLGFVTDYAGPLADPIINFDPLGDLLMQTIREATVASEITSAFGRRRVADVDLLRVLQAEVPPPEGVGTDELWRCTWCHEYEQEVPVDGAAIAQRLELEVIEVRARLEPLLEANPYLTRLFTTLSPDEMELDPIFGFNPDLPEVDNTYTATIVTECAALRYTELPNGRRVPADLEPTMRQAGETLRGEVPAAARVELMSTAGPGMLISEGDPEDLWPPAEAPREGGRPAPMNPMDPMDPMDPTAGGGGPMDPESSASSEGCGCAAGEGQGSLWLLLLCALPLLRRRDA